MRVMLGALIGALALLRSAAARADEGLQVSQLPLSKPFDQPFFSLDGSHVELFSLLFLFLTTVVVMSVRKRRQLVRHIVQIVSLLVFFYVVFSCLGVFGMIRNTIHGLTLIGTVYTESFFWISLPVCVIAFSVITGPFFCGWICPTGTIQELFAMVREGLTKKRAPRATPANLTLLTAAAAGFLALVGWVGQERQLFVEDSSLYWAASSLLLPLLVLLGWADDLAIRSLRWVSLGAILFSSLFKVTITSPVHFAFVDVLDPASAITTLVLAVASIFVARAWCRYLCPWGMLMSLVHRYSRLVVVATHNDTACTKCGLCAKACRVDAVEPGLVRSELCQLCYACVDACPRGGIEAVDRWKLALGAAATAEQTDEEQAEGSAS